MTQNDAHDYIYIVQWDDSVHRPSYMVHHGIKLNPGVDRADFEKFMKEKGFALIGNVKTRAGGIEAQYLLTDDTGNPPTRFETLDLNLESFGTHASVKKFKMSGSWKKALEKVGSSDKE